jgi:hypothetical protein
MNQSTALPKAPPAAPARKKGETPIEGAPRQPASTEAWREFHERLAAALVGLEEDEFLVLVRKGTNRFVQFMDQGAYGMRLESVSDYYLPEKQHLSEEEYQSLMELGWNAPTGLPDEFGHKVNGSPNYFLDLARPVPYPGVALLGILTMIQVHGALHPGQLEYRAASIEGTSIRFPHLPIRRCREPGRKLTS